MRRTNLGWSILIVSAATVLYVHFHSTELQDLKGIAALLDHGFDCLVAAFLFAIATLIGFALTQRVRIDFDNPAEAISISSFLGTGTLGLTFLGLGLAGLLRVSFLVLLIGFGIVFSAKEATLLYSIVKRGVASATATRERKTMVLIFICMVTLFFLRAASPPITADELIYHLPVTAEFVKASRVYPLFDNSHGNFPFLIHMVYALAIMARADIAARIFSLILGIATAFSLYGFCTRYLDRRTGLLALFSFFASGMVVEVAVTARIDVSLAGMLFTSTYSMINYLSTRRAGWLWISALLAGFSLGIKTSAALWLLLIAIMYVAVSAVSRQTPLSITLRRGLYYAILVFAIASPWYVKNFVWFHNAFYPLFSGEVAESGPGGVRYFDHDDETKLDHYFALASHEIPATVAWQEEELSRFRSMRPQRHPFRLWEYFTQPNTYLMSEPYHFPNYLFLAIPLLLFVRANKWVLWLFILSMLFFFGIAASMWIARFHLPAYPALTIVSAYALKQFFDQRTFATALTKRLAIYILVINLSVVVAISVVTLRYFGTFNYLIGQTSRHSYLQSLSYYRPMEFINANLPNNSRVFIIGAQLNYGLQRDYLPDETWFATKWRRTLIQHGSLLTVNQDLKSQGFTHILFSADLFKFASLMGLKGSGALDLMYPNGEGRTDTDRDLAFQHLLLRNWSTFELYRQNFLELVYADENGYQVFRIK